MGTQIITAKPEVTEISKNKIYPLTNSWFNILVSSVDRNKFARVIANIKLSRWHSKKKNVSKNNILFVLLKNGIRGFFFIWDVRWVRTNSLQIVKKITWHGQKEKNIKLEISSAFPYASFSCRLVYIPTFD